MSYPFKNILNPIQFDDPEFVTLGLTKQIAKDLGATVHLLHVVPVVPPFSEPESGVTVNPHAEDESRDELQRIADKELAGIKYKIITRVSPGDVAKAVLETAKDIDADLIVLKTHGRRGIAHFIMGSVAEQVVRHAHCAVMTLTSTAKERHSG